MSESQEYATEGIWFGCLVERTTIAGELQYRAVVKDHYSNGDSYDIFAQGFMAKDELLDTLAKNAGVKKERWQQCHAVSKSGETLRTYYRDVEDWRIYMTGFHGDAMRSGAVGIYNVDRNSTELFTPTRKTSPWGKVQHQAIKGRPGDDGFGQIYHVSTGGHGGVFCAKKANAQIPEYMRSDDGWYEEDCEWAKVACVFQDLFPHVTHDEVLKVLADWNPDSWEKFTGKTLEPGMSTQRDTETFERDHANDYIVMTAWSHSNTTTWPFGDEQTVPEGMVGVRGVIGGRKNNNGHGVEQYFLVDATEYENRPMVGTGFVIDPKRHLTVEEYFSRQELEPPALFASYKFDDPVHGQKEWMVVPFGVIRDLGRDGHIGPTCFRDKGGVRDLVWLDPDEAGRFAHDFIQRYGTEPTYDVECDPELPELTAYQLNEVEYDRAVGVNLERYYFIKPETAGMTSEDVDVARDHGDLPCEFVEAWANKYNLIHAAEVMQEPKDPAGLGHTPYFDRPAISRSNSVTNNEKDTTMSENNKPLASNDNVAVWEKTLPSGDRIFSITETVGNEKVYSQMDAKFYDEEITAEEALDIYSGKSIVVKKEGPDGSTFDCAICLSEVVTKPSTGEDGTEYQNRYANLTPVFFRNSKDGEHFGYRVPAGKGEVAVDFYRTIGAKDNPIELTPRDCVRLLAGERIDKGIGEASLKEIVESQSNGKDYRTARCWMEFHQQKEEAPAAGKRASI